MNLRIASVLVAALCCATVASAHHILGVPHYAYDEQYPQTPVVTYRVEAGDYVVRMTGYPGKPTPGERCSLHVYITKKESGEPFDKKVTLSVQELSIFGSDRTIYGPIDARPEEKMYKFFPTFEREAEHMIRLHFEDGEGYTVLMPMTVGEPDSLWAWVGKIGGGLGVLLIVARAVHIKRKRAKTHTVEEPTEAPAFVGTKHPAA